MPLAPTLPHTLSPPGPHHTPRLVCPPFDSAGRSLVQRQQAAHPLRVGGHLGLHLWLELGSGKLHKWLKWLEPPPQASTPPDARACHRLSRTAYGRVPLPAVLNCSRTTSPVHVDVTPLVPIPILVYHTVPPCSVFSHRPGGVQFVSPYAPRTRFEDLLLGALPYWHH